MPIKSMDNLSAYIWCNIIGYLKSINNLTWIRLRTPKSSAISLLFFFGTACIYDNDLVLINANAAPGSGIPSGDTLGSASLLASYQNGKGCTSLSVICTVSNAEEHGWELATSVCLDTRWLCCLLLSSCSSGTGRNQFWNLSFKIFKTNCSSLFKLSLLKGFHGYLKSINPDLSDSWSHWGDLI